MSTDFTCRLLNQFEIDGDGLPRLDYGRLGVLASVRLFVTVNGVCFCGYVLELVGSLLRRRGLVNKLVFIRFEIKRIENHDLLGLRPPCDGDRPLDRTGLGRFRGRFGYILGGRRRIDNLNFGGVEPVSPVTVLKRTVISSLSDTSAGTLSFAIQHRPSL